MNHKIGVGDRVYECLKWFPGVDYSVRKKLGEGVVTLIVKNDETKERKMRVIWEGEDTAETLLSWHPEKELVNVNNVFKMED